MNLFINKKLLIKRAASSNCNVQARRQYDIEEIKHGHWRGVVHYQNKASGQCSECGRKGKLNVSRDDCGIWYIDMPRCPDCRAIMDGKIDYM